MSACRPSVGSCEQVGGNASPVDRVAFGWGEELVTRPPKERASRIDKVRPAAPVGEQQGIGKGSCRERVCKYVSLPLIAVTFKTYKICSRLYVFSHNTI